jgi:PhzF family phenazine biosynthesis protein
MRQWTVDAFATEPFKGNPACVLEPLQAWPTEVWMQALAAENNQSETAFLLRTHDPARFELKWFTPAVEVPLCGHATLAAAHVLFTELGLQGDVVTFDTLSGPLAVRRLGEGYEMDFPGTQPHRVEPPAGLAEALGVTPTEVWMAPYLVAVLADEAAVLAAAPDFAALKAVATAVPSSPGNVGVAALAPESPDYDVVSRFFAPGVGIPEDPATGSWHCLIAPLFSQKLGRAVLKYRQAYPGRGADLVCEPRGDRVLLRGDAQTVLESRLRVLPA